MNKEELKNKYSAFITEISEILGLGKPVDILKLCATTDLFFQPLEKQIGILEQENEQLRKNLAENESDCEMCNFPKLKIELEKQIEELKADNDARRFAMAMSEKVEKQLRKENAELNKELDYQKQARSIAENAVVELSRENAKAKELLRKLVLEVKGYEEINGYDTCEPVQEAEQFISEVDK